MAKQNRFCIPVFFQRLVKIQMVLGHIRKNGRVELTTGNTPQSQRMGGNFHRHILHAAVHHITQGGLKIQHIRRSVLHRQDPFTDQSMQGAANSAGTACLIENRPDNMSRRCFSIGTGHADHAQFPGWFPIKPGRQFFHCLADIRHKQNRNRIDSRNRMLGQQGDCALFNRFRCKGMPVDRGSRHTNKESPWPNFSRIMGQGQDVRIQVWL